MGFCKIEDVILLLGLDDPDTNVIEYAIEEATTSIKNYTNQELEFMEEDIETFDGMGLQKRLFLSQLPVIEVTAVSENDTLLVEGHHYQLGRWGILHRIDGRRWRQGYANIVVEYSHGHKKLPLEIESVCARASSRMYQAYLKVKLTDGAVGVSNYSLGDYSINFASEHLGGVSPGLTGLSGSQFLLPWEKELLNKYKNLNRTV